MLEEACGQRVDQEPDVFRVHPYKLVHSVEATYGLVLLVAYPILSQPNLAGDIGLSGSRGPLLTRSPLSSGREFYNSSSASLEYPEP